MDQLEWSGVQWLVNQGVAIAVLVFLLVRLEKRLAAIHDTLDALVLELTRRQLVRDSLPPVQGGAAGTQPEQERG